MLSQNERKRIIALINREVVPAIGCTEPIAAALCTAGGLQITPNSEVLDTEFNVIPGLYAIGNVSGSMFHGT